MIGDTMKTYHLLSLLGSVLLLIACNESSPSPAAVTTLPPATAVITIQSNTTIPNVSPGSAVVDSPPPAPQTDNQVVLAQAGEVAQVLKNQDMAALSTYIHPLQGIRFSPYAFVKDTDQVFSAEQISAILSDGSVYPWGNYAGTGEPINLSFADYYSKFIYDVDFANAPQVSLNHRLSSGNSIDNAPEFYPGSMVVEYYFPGFDPQYSGMDWRSLKMIFTEANNTWYLAGLIHDEWTP
jgi:hypothetical protein